MPTKKTPQQQAESLTALDSVLNDIADNRAEQIADKLDALTLQKTLEKISNNNREMGQETQAILSQLRMGLYSKIAQENAEAEAATIPDEEIEAMRRRAFNPGKVLRAISSNDHDNDDDDDTQMRLLMGGQ